MAIKILYNTTDEVNLATARELAGRAGLELEWVFPKEVAGGVTDGDAIVHDLDHLARGAEWHRQVEQLAKRPPQLPTAVHSYGLEAEHIAALEENGVVVSRALDGDLFGRLAGVVRGDGPKEQAA